MSQIVEVAEHPMNIIIALIIYDYFGGQLPARRLPSESPIRHSLSDHVSHQKILSLAEQQQERKHVFPVWVDSNMIMFNKVP